MDPVARDDVLDPPSALARGALQRYEASERFSELFGELVAIAAVARYVYDDPPLTESDIDSYLQASFEFHNSWRHA